MFLSVMCVQLLSPRGHFSFGQGVQYKVDLSCGWWLRGSVYHEEGFFFMKKGLWLPLLSALAQGRDRRQTVDRTLSRFLLPLE